MKSDSEIGSRRELWIDMVKGIACVLVAFGHFYQSMVRSGIVPNDSLFGWTNQTIYFFHVPLFFICSGYLYQKKPRIPGAAGWAKQALKKLLDLGVPYVVFTIVLLLIKKAAASQINMPEEGIIETLLLHPTAPYWYLYALFFMFLLAPVVRTTHGMLVLLAAALAMKCAEMFLLPRFENVPFVLATLSGNAVWFVSGMVLRMFAIPQKLNRITTFFGCAFLPLSVWIWMARIESPLLFFAMGILGCLLTISGCCLYRGAQSAISVWLTRYNMPIFLMHMYFAAGLRIVLLHFGITQAFLHVTVGLALCFIGPAIAGWVMEKSRYLNFLMYPSQTLRVLS